MPKEWRGFMLGFTTSIITVVIVGLIIAIGPQGLAPQQSANGNHLSVTPRTTPTIPLQLKILPTFTATPVGPPPPTPTATPAAAFAYKYAPSHPGLPTTNSNIHLGLTFNSLITDLTQEQSVDFVWGATNGSQPTGKYNIAYNPYSRIGNSGNSQVLYTIDWFMKNHPDWIEYHCDQQTVAYSGDEVNTPLDVSNPAVLNFLMQNEYIPQIQQGYQAIGFDNVQPLNYDGRCGHFDAHHQWVQQFTGQVYDSALRAMILNWAQTMYHMLHAYAANIAVAMNSPYEFSAYATSDALLQYMDIMVDERGFTNWGTNETGFIGDWRWQTLMQVYQRFTAAGGAIYSINQEPSLDITHQQMEWALANYLLFKGSYSYISVVGEQQYGYFIDQSEYHLQIGAPTGSMYANQCAYERSFSHGVALVNPSTTQDCTVYLPTNTYTDPYQQPVGGKVTILPQNGLVLLG